MNRAEYANAIRDLLALDVDSSTLLPADDSSHGFDNIADVLGVSPSLLERYVAAAAKISRLAVGERDAAPAQVTYTVKGDLSQNQTLDGQPLGTRGGTTVTHNFPVDGEYLIRLSLLKLSFGQVFGEGAEGEELEVTLNGQRVKLFKLDEVPMFFMRESPGSHPGEAAADRSARRAGEDDARHPPRVPLKVKAGPQTIGVAFLQKATPRTRTSVRRPVSSTYDVFIGMQYGYTTAPHLSRVVITGPYNPTGLGDTPSRRRVFVCRPDVAGATKRACARQIVSTLVRRAYRRAPTDADVEPLLAFYQQERDKTGNFEAGIEMALRRDPRRSRVHLPLRADAGRRRGRDAVSRQRHRAGLAALLLPVVVDPGRRAAEAGDRRQAAPAGRAREADAPDAGRSEGAGAGHQLRQPVAVSCAT